MRNLGPISILSEIELKEVISQDISFKKRVIISGYSDFDLQQLVLVRGDGTTILAPFQMFKVSGIGLVPDFYNLEIIDYGNTIKLGEYEASTDYLLYELDPSYRAWAQFNEIN